MLTNIGHRRAHALGDPGGEGDACCLAAGDGLDGLVADVAADFFHRQIADFGAGAREEDDFAAVDVDRGFPAGGERVGLLRAEVHRLDFQQQLGRGQRGVPVPVARPVDFRCNPAAHVLLSSEVRFFLSRVAQPVHAEGWPYDRLASPARNDMEVARI